MEITPTPKQCTNCNSAKAETREVERREKHAGVEFIARLPARVCLDCGDELFGPELEMLDLAIAHWLARSGHVDGEAFRFMRKAIGRGAKELAELLGVSPETLSRWESGAMPMDAHAFVIVGGMVADRTADRAETVVRLEATRKPLAVTEPVRLDVRELLAPNDERVSRATYDAKIAELIRAQQEAEESKQREAAAREQVRQAEQALADVARDRANVVNEVGQERALRDAAQRRLGDATTKNAALEQRVRELETNSATLIAGLRRYIAGYNESQAELARLRSAPGMGTGALLGAAGMGLAALIAGAAGGDDAPARPTARSPVRKRR